jgi:hypothetical protein
LITFFNHGVYVILTPPGEVLKGTFPKLKYEELGSGEVAKDRSPIPPALASGDILKNGTAVVTTLIGSEFWAFVEIDNEIHTNTATNFNAVDFIVVL